MSLSVGLPRIDAALTFSGQAPQDSCPCLRYTETSHRFAYCTRIKTTVETSNAGNTNFLDKNTVVGKCLYDYDRCSGFLKAVRN